MARTYVDKEKARELLFELRNECIASNVKEDTTRGILYSINELEKLPTADVAEVVRCKDCKFRYQYEEFDRNTQEIYVCCECGLLHTDFGEEGFCSCGERKGSEQNEEEKPARSAPGV